MRVPNEFQKILNIKDQLIEKKNGLLKNQTFMLTGKLNGISRAEAKSLIEENSGTTVSSVTKKLNYLIVGEKPTKRKIETAKKLKITTIDQNQFLKILNKAS
jgi:DNA ligase (NAD+)